MLVMLSALFPLPHSEVTRSEMWDILSVAALMVMTNVLGLQWFKREERVNHGGFILWSSIIMGLGILLLMLTSYSLVNGQGSNVALLALLSPPVIVVIIMSFKRYFDEGYSYQIAKDIGKVRPGTWYFSHTTAYAPQEQPTKVSNNRWLPKLSSGLIIMAAVAGGFVTDNSLDAYLLYCANIIIAAAFTWLSFWGCWMDLIHVTRAKLSSAL
ncbi:hypothetical protein [Pseudoalteromonas obscura]|uniref:Uncharacterized protein n=1 Tax=Pseudoalteromonas obscura TaxID=3048491 RepID=A0ABT7EJ07_9GAMM|nr:hypothetical protein [Pseudoalteromonas sp. P94(2023)]MDK2595029.1 hypothetical protein [Pseudoalteromonas sp. P94(2023)]